MVLKLEIAGPYGHTDRAKLTKSCREYFGIDDATYLGARLKYFDEECRETKNFKIHIRRNYTKLLSYRVRGGYGRWFTSKYRIDEENIQRYDWLHSGWILVLKIAHGILKVAAFACKALGYPHIGLICDCLANGAKEGYKYLENRNSNIGRQIVYGSDFNNNNIGRQIAYGSDFKNNNIGRQIAYGSDFKNNKISVMQVKKSKEKDKFCEIKKL